MLLYASLATLVLPYILWGALQSVVIAMASSLVTAPVSLSGMLIVQMLWAPPSQFWFLYALLVMQVVAAVALPKTGAGRFLIYAIVARLSLELFEPPSVLDIIMRNWLFFAAGAWFGSVGVKLVSSFRPRADVLAITGLIFLTFAYDCIRHGGEFAALAAMPAAVTGIAFTVLLSLRLPASLSPIVIYLGQRSMPIYLVHVFAVAGTRILFVRILNIDQPLLVMTIAIILGLALPLVADWIARRMGVAQALGFA